jgi:hypothetical protein
LKQELEQTQNSTKLMKAKILSTEKVNRIIQNQNQDMLKLKNELKR